MGRIKVKGHRGGQESARSEVSTGPHLPAPWPRGTRVRAAGAKGLAAPDVRVRAGGLEAREPSPGSRSWSKDSTRNGRKTPRKPGNVCNEHVSRQNKTKQFAFLKIQYLFIWQRGREH